ncbi:efflux transporter outer membrane subunit [Cognatilysobacter lacus]|uniref:Efflux transporter outer membrane subunit n=1 Tax=Cognatilysobacter lacus TaxID=1643323 RepID=A0A5D8Z188_9GAMM|nr:efflux transporter outer membrane subunit [Lysobacter lacus]TZF88755.1 efflux transporter outer membrane subunit [Lysobacter lacus]
MTRNSAAPALRRLAPLVLALAVAGCASMRGVDPKAHPLDADALAASQTLSGAGHVPLQRDWWRAFGDPQLDTLIDEALQGQPSLAAADARVRQAVAQAGLADSARQPMVGATAQYSGIRIPESIAPPPLGGEYKGVILLGLNIKYSPDLWGGQRARYDAAIGQLRAVEVEAQASRLTLASNIARAYVGLAQAYDALDVATSEKSRSQKLLGLGRQRVKAGIDNQLQTRNAEVLVDSASQQAQAAQQQIDGAKHAIAALLGKGPDRAASIVRPKLLKAPPPGVPSVIPSELLGHRPDVVASRWRAEAASRAIHSAKSEFYPAVNLSALIGVAAGGLTDLFSTKALLAQGGPALTLPIFDGGRLRNNLARTDAEYDLAVAAYNGSLVTGLREVADALDTARALDAQIASVRLARQSAQAALSLANTRYKAGLTTQIDVLAAQRPLLQLDQQLAALRAQRLIATVDLDQALGGGLELTAPPSEPDAATASR